MKKKKVIMHLITITLWHNERFSHFEIFIYLFNIVMHKYMFGRVFFFFFFLVLFLHLKTIILGHNWRQLMPMLVIFFWRKRHLSPYIFESRSIYSLHFSSSQFGPCYFQVTVNLISTVNSRMKNVYVADRVYSWHT